MKPDCVDYYLVQENWAKLNEVYQKVEDVDLYVGGLSETPVGGNKHCWLIADVSPKLKRAMCNCETQPPASIG